MSDIRRRRKSNQSSDDLSDSCEELNVTKETQSSEQTDGHQDSECDIYESDSDAESQDGGEQRESGDGQEEEKPQKKLDDDEDRRNPQYIPKRGTFYEHDDRTTDEITDNNPETQTSVKETKEKKVWKDKGDRWDHDRYNDEEQAPKKPEELIATYGYDIRNEEGPPRARRRRRYGRGPNKYTRNWEDEDAYGKTGNTPGRVNNRRFHKNNEDFPTLGSSKNAPSKVEEPVISSAWYSSKNKTQNKVQNFPPLQSQQDNTKSKTSTVSNTSTNDNKAPNGSTNTAWKKDGKILVQNQNANGSNGSGGDAEKLASNKVSPRENNKRNAQESVSLAASRTRGRGFKSNANNNMVTNRIVENKSKGRGSGPVAIENRRNNTAQLNDEHQLVHDMKQLNVNDSTQYHQTARHNKGFFASSNQHRSNAVPPRMQQQQSHQQQTHSQQQTIQQQQDGSGNRPKRYSSQRQRTTISETSGQQNYQSQHGQHGYFPPQGYPQGHFEQSSAVAPATTAMAGQPVISLPPSGQPAGYPPPAYLVPSPQFIPPQTAPPSIINYVPGPNGPTFPPNFQGYQGYNPSVQPQGPPPPQELFQPQGCTYYSPAQQQQQQAQTAPMRRPKAAIPILPPPDNQQSSRGRGRSTQQYQQNNQPGNTQQTEQEVKINTVAGSDDKPVPGQFDSVQIEQSNTPKDQESQKIQASLDAVRTVNIDEIVDKNINVDTHIMLDASSVKKDNLDDSVSVKTLLETTSNEKDAVSHNPAILATTTTTTETEHELSNIESAITENTIVEKAAA
ncbi:protein CASC3-like isoform X2 [Odontomachus brunneus]|uniref:protein CASC3-like isoform X2 n=1 Tax=Odontomachus brunneus TaxID=486640 RepID=UPI0013F19A52|nr:protein CASC3-like isoform X2 [Odontomachus brunneus]